MFLICHVLLCTSVYVQKNLKRTGILSSSAVKSHHTVGSENTIKNFIFFNFGKRNVQIIQIILEAKTLVFFCFLTFIKYIFMQALSSQIDFYWLKSCKKVLRIMPRPCRWKVSSDWLSLKNFNCFFLMVNSLVVAPTNPKTKNTH